MAAPEVRLVRTEPEWTAFWRQVGRPAPEPALGERVGVAVFLGSRPTGGWGIRFLDPEDDGKALRVRYAVSAPTGFVTQAFTEPYALRLFPKRERVEAAEVKLP